MKKIFLFGFIISLSAFVSAQKYVPGTFENAAPEYMDKVLNADARLNPSKDELVIYYYREDGNYSPWALWMWALPGGDGNNNWNWTQNWTVIDGVGVMRFALDGSSTDGNKPVSSDGTVGLIVRQKNDWIKDGNIDRIWNVGSSNKIAIFSGDEKTYAAEKYKPGFVSAELISLNEIKLCLTGKYALTLEGDSGFKVYNSKGKYFDILSVKNSDSSDVNENWTSNVLIKLNEFADAADSLFVSHDSFRGKAQVLSNKLAVKIASESVPEKDYELGAVVSGNNVEFRLWAPTSTDVSVNLYKYGNDSNYAKNIKMKKNSSTGVWTGSAIFSEVEGMYYDYSVCNSKGQKQVLDPYARSMAAYENNGTAGRGCIIDLDSSKAFPEGGLKSDYVKLLQREDAVIYEVSVRDFTISNDSGVSAVPGTYKAFIEKIPYLKNLGITHVQLMPVLNFYFNNENEKSFDNRGVVNNSNYNWGYDPHNYFTPEGWYATNASDPYCRVKELRELIDVLHQNGIGVLLDVVYNHVADASILDDIVPGYYFRLTDDGKFKSNSGCGNDTATEREMMKKLVVDSTVHWVKNYKADGFRFDLMGLMEAGCVEEAYKECAKINSSVLFEGEGWKMYNGENGTKGMDQNYMLSTNNIAVFNDEFRDLCKAGGFNETGLGFITNKPVNLIRLFSNICGRPSSNYKADDPGDNLNYLACHDGLTLHDSIVNNLHLDETNDFEEIKKRIRLGNFIELTSQGIAFLHAGQERGRTKPNVNKFKSECINNFVRNSYDSSDNINQIIWSDKNYSDVTEYVKGLISIRKSTDAFRLGDASEIQKNVKLIPTFGEGKETGFVLAWTISDKKSSYFVAINAGKKSELIHAGLNFKNAEILSDGNKAGLNKIDNPCGVKIKGKNVELEPLTACIIKINK